MKHISELKGIGEGKKALLIGNGHSASTFDYSLIDQKNTWVFGINRIQQPISLDYCIYYDAPSKEQLKDFADNGDVDLIGFKTNECDYTNFYYNSDDIVFCDTGNHLLQFVSNLFSFDVIYLIGYDYKTDNKKLHYYDDQDSPSDAFDLYNRTIFQRALHKYTKPYCKCSNETLFNMENKEGVFTCKCVEENIFKCRHIFNLNADSALKKFTYKNIQEEICQKN